MRAFTAFVVALCLSVASADLTSWSDAAKAQGIVGPDGLLSGLHLQTEVYVEYASLDTITITPNCTGATEGHTFEASVVQLDGRIPTSLTPFYTRTQPLISFETKPNTYYTVLMHDWEGAYQHFAAFNSFGIDVAVGDVTLPFFQPANYFAQNHTYVWMVFEQPNGRPIKLDPEDIKTWQSSLLGRYSFNVTDVISKYNLGDPIGINWSEASVDAYVPTLWYALLDQPSISDSVKAKVAGVPGLACKNLGFSG